MRTVFVHNPLSASRDGESLQWTTGRITSECPAEYESKRGRLVAVKELLKRSYPKDQQAQARYISEHQLAVIA